MISKTSIGRSFGGLIRYCIEAKNKGEKRTERGEILASANCFGNKNQLIRQFNDVRNTNKRVERPVWHTSYSFAPQDMDKVNNSMLIEITQEFAKEFGFEQYVAILHKDTTEFKHFHFIGNRVNLIGKTVSDSKNYQKVTAFCRKMELKYMLTQVLNPKAFLSKGKQNIPRKDKRKDKLKQVMQEILKTCKSVPELKDRLSENGYKIEIQRGIAITDEKSVRIKGSQIGYSLEKIQTILQKNLYRELNLNQNKGLSHQLGIEIN